MSYNLLSGSVEFVGDALGLTENLVNTHATQTITGAKTFMNITASAEGDGTYALHAAGTLSVAGNVEVTDGMVHEGDTDTRFTFDPDEISLTAGNNLGLNITTGHVAVNGDGTPKNQNLDFVVYSRDTNNGLKYDANTRAFQVGWIGNPSFNRSDVLLSVSSSYHTGSLFSIGHGDNPVFAVSGSRDYDTQSPRVLITGSLLVGGRHGSTQETAYAGGNIIAEGVITGSSGLRGELLNVHHGLEHVANSGQKKLAVKPHTGISVGGNGVAVDVMGLTDVGSVNTSTSNQDFICVSDYSNSNATMKMGVGDLLTQTVGSVANVGTGAGEVYKTTTSREVKLRTINAGTGITVTNNTLDVTIAAAAPPVSAYNNYGNQRCIVAGTSAGTISAASNMSFNGGRLMVTGALNTSGDITANAFFGDGSNLTGVGAGGVNGHVQVNISGSLNGGDSFKAVQSVTPHNTELYLTGALHAHHVDIAQTLVVDSQTTLYNNVTTHLTASAAHFTGGIRYATVLKTASYNLTEADRVVIFNSSNNMTATLPPITANNVGTVYTIKNLNSGEVHVTGSNPGTEQFIEGVQYLVLSGAMVANGPYLTVTSCAAGPNFDWYVIAKQLSST
jgi:hypothetical protein